MKLGISTRTFSRATFEETFYVVQAHGLECVQLNFSCVGMPTLPEKIAPDLAKNIRTELERRALFIAAVSGTCNLIHPDPKQRQEGIQRLQKLIGSSRALGTPIVTLCAGTRYPDDMWRAHPENNSAEAWSDLISSLELLLPLAQQNGIVLGIEPEPSNVVESARKARRLLDEMRSPVLKIIFDAANLLQPESLTKQDAIFQEAFDLLGPEIVLAHAKDLTPRPGSDFVAAGEGAVDYTLYLTLLDKTGFDGALILHTLAEEQVPASVTFLRKVLTGLPARPKRKTHALLQSRPD